MSDLQNLIEAAWEGRAELSPSHAPADVKNAVQEVLGQLDSGAIRVAQRINGEWTTRMSMREQWSTHGLLSEAAHRLARAFT